MEGNCVDSKGTGLELWPQELLDKIFSELNLFDLANVSDVCKRWNYIAENTAITLTVNRTIIDEEKHDFFVYLAGLMESKEYRNLIVEADIRDLNFEELSALFPLLHKCKNLRTFKMGYIHLKTHQEDFMVWESIMSLNGTLKNLDIIRSDFSKSISEPYITLTGLVKLSSKYCNEEIFKELILANKDTLREIDIEYPGEDIVRAISQCAQLRHLSITHTQTGCDLAKYIQPSTTLEYKYIDSYSLDPIEENCPHVTKLVLYFSDDCMRDNLIKITRFSNVKELIFRFRNEPENTTISNAIEIASRFHKLKVLKMKLKLEHLDLILSAFDTVPSLCKIMLSTSPFAQINGPEFKKGIENARNLRSCGYKASFVGIDDKYCLIIHRKMENRAN